MLHSQKVRVGNALSRVATCLVYLMVIEPRVGYTLGESWLTTYRTSRYMQQVLPTRQNSWNSCGYREISATFYIFFQGNDVFFRQPPSFIVFFTDPSVHFLIPIAHHLTISKGIAPSAYFCKLQWCPCHHIKAFAPPRQNDLVSFFSPAVEIYSFTSGYALIYSEPLQEGIHWK